MNIGNIGSSYAVNLDAQMERRKDGLTECTDQQDSVHTSEKALMLSRQADALQQQMQPRAEILSQFAGIADSTMDFDDSVVDHIIGQL
jgi:hypothetical protein